tara:strand:- start:1860 stop:3974 length:2115 start_codon:yes stop_codon:yes gene_type:complete
LLRLFHKLYGFIIQEVSLQKNSLFLWSPFFLAIGIAIYFMLRVEPPFILGFSFVLGGLGAVLATYKRRHEVERRRVQFVFAHLFFLMALGFGTAQVRTALVYTPLLNKALGPVDVIGTVERVEPQGIGQGSRIILRDLDVERLELEQTPRKVRLKLRKDEGVLSGQRIKVLAKLNPPSAPVSPGAFDFQRYAFFKGLGAVGFIYNQPEILKEASGLSHFWAKTRERLSQRVERQLKGRQGAVANALMTGQRGSIAKQDIQAMRDAGLAHLLAISGMHVGMIVGVLFFFSRLFMAAIPNMALYYPIKKYAAVFALVGAILYTLIVGATIPTQRALMMSGLVLIAIMLDRTAISMRLVALAAFVVLLFSPESLVSVSFQMSFAAVVALVCFYERISPYWTKLYSHAGFMRRAMLYLIGVILTTVVAGFATGFFAMYHFQTFALYGTIANIIAVPIMAFIVMPALLFSYLLMPIGLEEVSLDIAGYGISWILASAHWVANMDGAVSRFVAFPFLPFVIIVICLWFMCLWRGALSQIALGIALLTSISLFFVKQPTIQISSDFKLVSIRDDDGHIVVSSGRQDRYTADNWLRRNGQKTREKQTFPKEGAFREGLPFRCDIFGCRGELEGVKIAYSKSLKSLQDDCRWADLVLSENPVKKRECKAGKVIDRFDIWRDGSHAIWLNNGSISVKTDQQTRGKRPWNKRELR